MRNPDPKIFFLIQSKRLFKSYFEKRIEEAKSVASAELENFLGRTPTQREVSLYLERCACRLKLFGIGICLEYAHSTDPVLVE